MSDGWLLLRLLLVLPAIFLVAYILTGLVMGLVGSFWPLLLAGALFLIVIAKVLS